jgi:hypothetical protein
MPTIRVYVYVAAMLAVLGGLAFLLMYGSQDEQRAIAKSWEEFSAMVAGGEGIKGPEWTTVSQRVAVDLWPGKDADDVGAQALRKTHSDLTIIVGDVARELAAAPTAREELKARDPSSLEIHDGFVAAAAKGSAAYAAWVATEGTALLRKRMDALSAPPR